MANKKISELSSAGALTGTESVEIVQGGANVKTTTQDIADLGGGGGTWGSITGTLSSQTDLQSALNAKLNAIATIVDGGTNYTLQASDLTLINAGANLIIEGDGTGTLTIPLNSSVAFPTNCFIGFRGFILVATTGGVTATPSNASLDCDPDFLFALEKTATNTWNVHNGAEAGVGGGDVVEADIVGVQDLYIPASAMWPKTTSGCASLAKSEIATSLLNIQTLDFDQTTQEFAQFTIALPRKWNNGTLTAVFYWTASSGAGTVQWGISGGAYSNDDALTTAFGSAQTSDDTLIATNDLHISPATSAITLSGSPSDSDFLGIQISRNPASDTLSADAKLLGVSLRITTDAAIDA